MKFRWHAPVLAGPAQWWGWLAPLVVMPLNRALPPLPAGWRYLRCLDRRAAYRLPVWMYWLALAWEWRWQALEPLRAAGLVKVRDGDYWANARPWFWNAERETSFRSILRGLPQ